jgi:hypothetical protein
MKWRSEFYKIKRDKRNSIMIEKKSNNIGNKE